MTTPADTTNPSAPIAATPDPRAPYRVRHIGSVRHQSRLPPCVENLLRRGGIGLRDGALHAWLGVCTELGLGSTSRQHKIHAHIKLHKFEGE